MALYVVTFKGELAIEADSKKEARKIADAWLARQEAALPDPSRPQITAAMARVQEDKTRKEPTSEARADANGHKVNKRKKSR